MRNILCACAMILFAACGNSNDNIPSDVIPKDKMLNIMMDIHLAEAGIKERYTGKVDSMNQAMVDYYEFIFNKHGINKEQFKKSLSFYTDNPKYLHDVYQKMIEEMSSKEVELNKK